MTLSAKSKAASASLYLLLGQLDMGRDVLVAAEGWGKWLLFWARLGEVWMTPFRAPTMARWFPCRAPIRPVAPAMAGRVELALPGWTATPAMPTPFTCCWGGLWAADGGVESEDVLLPLLWPPDRGS